MGCGRIDQKGTDLRRRAGGCTTCCGYGVCGGPAAGNGALPQVKARGRTQLSGGGPASVVVVVEAAGDDGNHVRLDVVDQTVLLGYPA
jgi:hypothetical protein